MFLECTSAVKFYTCKHKEQEREAKPLFQNALNLFYGDIFLEVQHVTICQTIVLHSEQIIGF